MQEREKHEHLFALSSSLVSTLNPREIEEIAVREMAEGTGAAACALLYLGPERNQGYLSTCYPEQKPAGRSLTGEECLDLSSLISLPDAQLVQAGQSRGLDQLLQRFQAGAAMVYAMAAGDAPAAALLLTFPALPELEAEEIALYDGTVRQLAAALNNCWRYRQTQRRLTELHVHHELSLAASTAKGAEELWGQAAQILTRHLAADSCTVWAVDKELRALGSAGAAHAETAIRLGEGPAGQVAQSGRPFLSDQSGPLDGANPAVRAVLCVPLMEQGQVVAVVSLESARPDAFGQEDLSLLTAVAGQLSLELERRQGWEEAQQRVRELTALMRVSAAMQRATRLEEILEVLMVEAFGLVGKEHGSVLLLDRATNRLRVAASRGLPDQVVAELNRTGVPATFGTFAHVLESGELIEIPDTSADPRVAGGYGPVPRQLSNIPLKADRQMIGILVLDAVAPNDTTRRLLQAMADMATLAIERSWRYEETRQQLEQVRFLQEIALAATSTLNFDQVLRRSIQALQRWLKFEVFGFLVVDERSGMLRPHPAFVGVPDSLLELALPVGQGITGRVAQTGNPILCPDVEEDPYYIHALAGMRSELAVPVKVGNRVVAVIDLESVRPNAFGEQELRMITSMAYELAVALENARVYEWEQQQRHVAETMRQAALMLGATLDIDDLLIQSLSYMEKLLPSQAAFVVLFRRGQVEQAQARGAELPPPGSWLLPGSFGARVYVEQRAIRLSDTSLEPGWAPWPGTENLRSWIGVPFIAKEQVFGLLILGAAEPNLYGREEAMIAISFAGQLALALDRVRFYEQERRRTKQIDLLYSMSQRVAGIIERGPLLEEVIRFLHQALHLEWSGVGLIEGEELEIQAAVGPIEVGGKLAGMRLPLDAPGILSWVARNGVPLLVPDTSANPRFRPMSDTAQVKAEMAVPLRAKGQVIGVLDVQGRSVDQFDESDLSTLQALSVQISGAIERAQLYTDLRKSLEQMREVDRLRNDFLSAINHEMRAPLTAILGFTDFLLREQAGPLTAHQREYLGDVRSSGERILNLVENLLKAARLEEGEILPQCAVVRIADVVAQTTATVRPAAMEKTIALSSRIPADLPDTWADPSMVERILINLLSNAVKFTPPGGAVWIDARPRDNEPEMIEVSVSDTGVGIDPKQVDQIFKRYHQLNTPGGGQRSGTGLGLYIVKGLVELHGGRVWVESALGEGSKFAFTLPVVREENRGNAI